MKTKIDKKAKKRSLSETSLSIKPNQKQMTVTASKKSPKKAKLVGLEHGNSTMGNKVQILKKMYKQKEKPKIKQTNKGLLAEIKTEEDTKLSIAEFNGESAAEKMKAKVYNSKISRLKRLKRELYMKEKKKRQDKLNVASITLSTEEIEAKIEEIRNREVLSKNAKKKLGILNRKLKLQKAALNKSEKLNTIEKKGNKKKQQIGVFIKTEPVSNEDNKNKIKKKHVKHETIKIKQEKSNQNDSNIIETENEEDEDEDEDQSDTETEESMHNANEQFEDESDEDEEDEDTENDEDTEDDDDEKANIFKVKKEDEKKPQKQAKQSLEHQKNDQYVLFVGNLSSDVTADDLKQHFLTKVDTVSNVRIPIKAKTPRGFAFVKVTNSADFEKGLLLHQTIIKKRQIIVKPSNNKKKNVDKYFGIMKKKPQAFQKAKIFAGGNQGKQKPLKKEKQS